VEKKDVVVLAGVMGLQAQDLIPLRIIIQVLMVIIRQVLSLVTSIINYKYEKDFNNIIMFITFFQWNITDNDDEYWFRP
jgi:hypothetical protein